MPELPARYKTPFQKAPQTVRFISRYFRNDLTEMNCQRLMMLPVSMTVKR